MIILMEWRHQKDIIKENMANKQTPIDYIKDNLFYPIQLNQLERVLSEAQKMHKEQIMKANEDGFQECMCADFQSEPMTAEQYYNQTYGTK